MAASDGQVVCATARWAPGGRPLGEVVRGGAPLPAVLRIVRGSCGGLGVPSLPHPSLQPTVMLVSAGRRRQIIAQAVKLRPGRGPVAVGPRLSIPETYAGWFELLSEEGRAGRCVESVAELSRRPCPCLVREPLRAILAKEADRDRDRDRADSDETSSSGGAAVQAADASRTLAVGETISPGEEVSLPGGSNHPRGRYLTCSTSRGDTVLLSLEQRGRFSPLAKEHNISGAHSARTLLAKRLPLTVRLLHGPPPRPARPLTRPRKAANLGHFTPDLPLRLLAAYEEEQVFAYPLQKENASLVAVPLSASLKVLRTRNDEVLRSLPEFARVAEKCTRLLAEVQDRIHVIDSKASPSPTSPAAGPASDGKTWRGVPFLRRSASSDAANLLASPRPHQDENRAPGTLATASSSPRLSASAAVTPDEYDEIDQIYDYVRGFAPLPKSIAAPLRSGSPPSPASPPASSPRGSPPRAAVSGRISSGAPTPTKPEPPPIETIPSKKVGSTGKVHGHALNGGLSQGLLLHPHPHLHQHHHATGAPGAVAGAPQKAEKRSRHKESKGTRLYLKHLPSNGVAPAGLGHSGARYKSLNNIHGAMDLDGAGAVLVASQSPPSPAQNPGAAGVGAGAAVGTLDSSHSGGRTSGDSGPGNKLPEKRSRKLSRPRSLTNLVWEMRGGAPPMAQAALDAPRGRLSLTGHKRLGTLYL
ncbi:GRB2-associated and regulator of MAPK protein [Frankliniella fusca]|uniref:GRB2-associated and regulator of MAPK protein n=1 Tax=Frankliniella fusca TaxID=407009 RepID=A0AAE1HZS2_9NEOP|nr:GRB2-associated and regulator of MAPK protein [Frankliniella fusca]